MIVIEANEYAIVCDYCHSSTEQIAGMMNSLESAQVLAEAFDFREREFRHTCPACEAVGVNR